MVTAPAWSIQSQSTSLARSASENKVPAQNSAKVEGTSAVTVSRAGPQITMDQNFRPFITQTAPANLPSVHQPLQSVKIVQPPLIPAHTDIAKIVQKLLQPKLPDHPTWTPPSRDYMNKAFTCQTCELTVNEVDTVLLCDACERGFHMKCLQPSIIRSIHNRVDWHCTRCLSLSGGKLLAPKYGRVMRSSNTSPSFSPSTGGIQLSSEMKAGSLDPKVSAQMLTTNENSIPTVSTANNNVQMSFDSKDLDMRDAQGANISSSIETIDEKSDPNNCMKSASSSTSTGLPGESSDQQINSKALTCKETLESETLPKLYEPAKSEDLQLSQVSQVEMLVTLDNAEIPLDRHGGENLISSKQKEAHGGENSSYDIKRDDQDVVHAHFVEGSGTNTEGEAHSALSSDSSHAVEWIGDVVCLEDEKKYYQSCCVDGVTYRLQGHALFPSSHGKLTPSKLQASKSSCIPL